MFYDFTTIRAKWDDLPKEKQDVFLAELATMLVGDRMEILPAAVPQNWSSIQKLISSEMGMASTYRGGAVALLGLAIFVYLALFTPIKWYWLIAIAIGLFYVVQKTQLRLARTAIKKAAESCPILFAPLWESKAFAIKLADSVDFYDNASSQNRWQDIVLHAAGWKELATQKITSRQDALEELGASISAMVKRNSHNTEDSRHDA